jgi:hypothetical protein
VSGKAPPTLTWSGIQALLEQAQSDVLILLDCCCSGIASTVEGNGVAELIAACGYNNKALGVGVYSFTSALIMELQKLSTKPIFSVGELYSNIYLNIQHRTLMDGTERHPPPIHLQLTQESRFPRSIQLSPSRKVSEQATSGGVSLSDSSAFHPDTGVTRGSAFSSQATVKSSSAHSPSSSNVPNLDHTTELGTIPPETKVPRISFSVRLKDTFRPHELSKDLFKEWLRMIPALADEVKAEAGFDSFSSLLIVSVPISLSIYVPRDSAAMCLGPITSSNLISGEASTAQPTSKTIGRTQTKLRMKSKPTADYHTKGRAVKERMRSLGDHVARDVTDGSALPSLLNVPYDYDIYNADGS